MINWDDIIRNNIPSDWETSWLGPRVVAVGHPLVGWVTISLRERAFRLGLSTAGPPDNQYDYGGFGWRQALIEDAASCLKTHGRPLGSQAKPWVINIKARDYWARSQHGIQVQDSKGRRARPQSGS